MHANATTLTPDLLQKMNAYWRAANYLSVGQIYLYDNPLLKEPLKLSHVKPLVVGHWALAFSFARAIQRPSLEVWRGQEANAELAQQALSYRAKCNRAARQGNYPAAMEGE